MMWTKIEYIKQHSRICCDCEDAVIELYINSAEEALLNVLGRTYVELVDVYGDVPNAVRQATLLLVDHFYTNRSVTSPQQLSAVPYNIDLLVKPYIKLTSDVYAEGVQYLTLGSQSKICFTAALPDDLLLQDVDFTVTVQNITAKNTSVTTAKSDCIKTGDNEYVVLVDTEALGVGILRLKLDVQIPDTDFPTGYRREVVYINPHANIIG